MGDVDEGSGRIYNIARHVYGYIVPCHFWSITVDEATTRSYAAHGPVSRTLPCTMCRRPSLELSRFGSKTAVPIAKAAFS